jgi:prepilin-type N-terminal cleavage/methylation domain-containing protein
VSVRARGFTLVELLVGTTVGLIVSLGAVVFLSHQAQAHGVAQGTLELQQSSRHALARLAEDIRLAGTGVGTDEAGVFRGVDLPPTFARGGATFRTNEFVLPTGNTTDDLGLLRAAAGATTLAAYSSGGTAELCGNHGFRVGDLLVLRSEDGLSGRSVVLGGVTPNVACSVGQCVDGCDAITFSPEATPTFSSGPSAADAEYTGGTAYGRVERVTWFVDAADPARPGIGRLRRAVGDCAARDRTCGELVADFVESLQVRRYEWRAGAWFDITDVAAGPTPGARVRVDLELTLRSRVAASRERPNPVRLELEGGRCVPATCQTDGFARRVLRTSLEIKNTGRGRYRR